MQRFRHAPFLPIVAYGFLVVISASLLTFNSCHEKSVLTGPVGPSGATVITIQVGDDFYYPYLANVPSGGTVRWVLSGNLANHTVTESTGAFDSGFVFTGPGASFEHQFTAADNGKAFSYACRTHGTCCGMRGTILVAGAAPPALPTFHGTTAPTPTFNRTPQPLPTFSTPPPPPPTQNPTPAPVPTY